MTSSTLTVAAIHNRYAERGGEDESFEAEAALLEQHGVRVVRAEVQTTVPSSWREHTKLGLGVIWSREWHHRLTQLIRRERVDLVHAHNTFPVISPSIYSAARRAGVPTVQTLHNYRLVCPSAMLFRDGGACEDCVGRLPWPGVVHSCYRDSRMQSAGVAAMLTAHRLLRTWSRNVDVFIALTELARQTFVAGGLPAEKFRIKPNFVGTDPGVRTEEGTAALYVGRLSAEKGVPTLLRAWHELDMPLRILGDGPLAQTVREHEQGSLAGRLTYGGRVSRAQVIDEMKRARLLVFPSEVYEMFPLTLIEAFACSLPVVAASGGAAGAIVDDGRTGVLFRAGDADDLRAELRSITADASRLRDLGQNGRREYEAKYTAESNARQLLAIYGDVLRHGGARRADPLAAGQTL